MIHHRDQAPDGGLDMVVAIDVFWFSKSAVLISN